MALLSGVNIGAPGTYVFGTTSGARPIIPQPFNVTYMIGFGSLSGAPKNTPTLVTTTTDFTNQFGTSASTASVDLYFANNPNGTLYFINTAIAQTFSCAFAVVSGQTHVAAGSISITVNGKAFTFTALGTETPTQIAADFVSLINADTVIGKEVTASVDGSGNLVIVETNPAFSTSVTGSTAVTVTDTTPNTPQQTDWVFAISNTFDPDLTPGFVIAPEVFQNSTTQTRLAVATAIQGLVSGNPYQWMGIIDCGSLTAVPNVTRAMVESATYSSPQGHLAYYFPYLLDTQNRVVPPSAAIAGLAITKFTAEGFSEPPAGAQYTLQGVTDVTYKATWSEQNIANPKGVNIILNKPRFGIVCWGARTLSADPLFAFVTTRIILNLIINSLRRGFDYEIFSGVGGQGQTLFNIQRKAVNLLDAFWRAGLLYGQTAADAYKVAADTTVQLPSLLQAGIVNMFCWVCPATIMERLIITVANVGIGELQIAVQSDLSLINQQRQQASNTTTTNTSGTGLSTGG